jgi:hypothetical protein
LLLTLIALGAALATTSCGGSSQSSADEPRLPRALASDLAEKSEAIASVLDAGDECGAANLADELKDAVDGAVAAGRIPPEFQAELQETAVELQNGINCTPEHEKENNGEDDGKGKEKGHEDETTTLGTTTTGTTVSTTEGEG